MLNSTVTVSVWVIETIGYGYHDTLVKLTSDLLDRERRLYAATCQPLREVALVYYLCPLNPDLNPLSIQTSIP